VNYSIQLQTTFNRIDLSAFKSIQTCSILHMCDKCSYMFHPNKTRGMDDIFKNVKLTLDLSSYRN